MAYSNVDSDTTLVVDSTALADVCTEWKAKISSVDLSSIDINGTFSALIDCGIGSNYFSSLKTALERSDKLANNIVKLIALSASEQTEEDNKSAALASNNTYGQASYERTGSGESAVSRVSSSNVGNYQVTTDNNEKDANIENDNETQKIELDTSEENELAASLLSINDGKLLDNINEEDGISKIKKEILASPNISDNLKEKILNMDENELKTIIFNILESGELISDFSKSLVTVFDNDLKNNYENSTIYDSAESISQIYDFVSKERDFQDQIKELYLGTSNIEKVDDNVITLTRSFVDLLASANAVSYEDILYDTKYQSNLLEGIEDIKKTFYLLSIVNNCNDDDKTSKLSSNIIIIGDDHNEQ